VNVRISTVLGVVLGVVGLLALAVPGLTTGLPTEDFAVTLLGGLLVVGALREVQRRRGTEPTYAETAEPEQAVELPTPGAEFDRRLDRLSGLLYRANERQRLREEVGDVAVATLRRRFDYTESEAREALRTGSWTDDPFAAAFLRGDTPAVDRLRRLRERLRRGGVFRYRARLAVDELYRIAQDREGDDAGD
jgi:hypothetical protein